MKKSILRVLAVTLLAAMLLMGLAACGGGANTPGAGKYEGDYGYFVGDGPEVATPSEGDDAFSLELKSGGKGTFTRDGASFDVTWKLDGENFSMTETFLGITNEYTGTLKDGKLTIFNGDPEDIWTYVYVFK